jgi:hypothetical protein
MSIHTPSQLDSRISDSLHAYPDLGSRPKAPLE